MREHFQRFKELLFNDQLYQVFVVSHIIVIHKLSGSGNDCDAFLKVYSDLLSILSEWYSNYQGCACM